MQRLCKKIEALYTDAFRPLGYRVELVVMPAERALREANAGAVDGDGARVEMNEDVLAQYPNPVKVDVPIAAVNLAAFAMTAESPVSEWSSFSGRNYLVAYPRGSKLWR